MNHIFNQEPLPEDILGVTIQRAIKEILGDTTQRDIEEILGDTTQRDIEEILGDTTQRDIKAILGDITQGDIEEILGDTTQIDIFIFLSSHSHEPLIKHSPDHTTAAVSFPSPTQPTQPSPRAEQHIPTPHDSPLHAVHSHGSDEGSLKLIELTNLVTKLSERIGVLEDDLKKTKQTYSAAVTKLILRVKKLEAKVKAGTARKGARVVLSEDDEDVEDDSSKQGRKLSDAEVQEKASTETEPIIQEVTPTKVIQDQGSSEKGNSEDIRIHSIMVADRLVM
ncbi:hypothetical protein Tco_1050960 [Tanacetum coccineum]